MRSLWEWCRRNLVTASVVGLVLVLTVFGFLVVGLTQSNRDRINDIQKSRVESCQRTYEGIRQVFQPFFPPPGRATAKQRADLKKFNTTIDGLIRGCTTQTKPKGTT